METFIKEYLPVYESILDIHCDIKLNTIMISHRAINKKLCVLLSDECIEVMINGRASILIKDMSDLGFIDTYRRIKSIPNDTNSLNNWKNVVFRINSSMIDVDDYDKMYGINLGFENEIYNLVELKEIINTGYDSYVMEVE